MSKFLSFTKGEAIGFIKNGKYANKIIYIDDKKDNKIPFDMDMLLNSILPQKRKNYEMIDEIKKSIKSGNWFKYKSIKDDIDDKIGKELNFYDGVVTPIPNMKKRDVMYVSAPSGAGKSVFTSIYANNFKKIYPERKIYLISRLDEDESIDKINGLERIILDESFLENPIDVKELHNSLVIFDDVDTIRNKDLKGEVKGLMDDILQCGRHENIYTIITSHMLNNNKETRIIMAEQTSITVFPNSGSTRFITYCLKQYLGLSSDEIRRILKLPSRWVMIYTHSPRYVLYQSGAYLL